MDIIEEFKQLVEIDSASGRERAIADVLKKETHRPGFPACWKIRPGPPSVGIQAT